MKAKKYKKSEHFMKSVYEMGFNHRAPYQILVDDTMCQACLQHKFDLKERSEVIFGAPARLFVTACTMESMRQAARESENPIITGAPFVGRRMELRRCRHDPKKSVRECISDLVGSDNPFHYGIATNDENLKRDMRQVPGVPLVFLEKTFPLLEPPTPLTIETIRKKETAKLSVSSFEKAIIKKEFGELPAVVEKRHKKKKLKGPNPLSIRKSKKKKILPPKNRSADDSADSIRKKPRKRAKKSQLNSNNNNNNNSKVE